MSPNKTHYLSSSVISFVIAVISVFREEYISFSVTFSLAFFFLFLEILAHRREAVSSLKDFNNGLEINS